MVLLKVASWLALGGLSLALFGLILELTGAYLLASAFQPFVFWDFVRRALKLSWKFFWRRHIPDKVKPALATMIETLRKFGHEEAAESFLGLGLLCVGIGLQILSVVLLIGVEVLRLLCGH